MKYILDGTRISDIRTFASELARAVQTDTGEIVDFGWDLHSLADHLQGGYGGSPPYEIVIEAAEEMVNAMGHEGLRQYCDEMLGVIASGGKGMVQPEDRQWYEDLRNKASQGVGQTLLDLLFEVIRVAPAALTLRARSGDVLKTYLDCSEVSASRRD